MLKPPHTQKLPLPLKPSKSVVTVHKERRLLQTPQAQKQGLWITPEGWTQGGAAGGAAPLLEIKENLRH